MRITRRIGVAGAFAALYAVFAAVVRIPFAGHASLNAGYLVLTSACILLPAADAMLAGGIGAAVAGLLMGDPFGVLVPQILYSLILAYGLRGVLAAEVEFREELEQIPDPAERKAGRIRLVVVFVTSALLFCAAGIFVSSALECLLCGIHPLIKLPRAVAAFGLDALVLCASYPIALLVRRAAAKAGVFQP